jgi:hypothetical protein
MAFDAADLLGSLFPEVPPAPVPERSDPEPPPPAAAEPKQPAARGYREPARPANGPENANTEAVSRARPRQGLPGAIPTPPAGEWLAMWRRAPQTTPPPKPCGWCGCSVHWQHVVGLTYLCANCRPPSFPFHVAGWFRVVATEDGPRVVRIDGPDMATDDGNRRFNHGR